MKKIICVLLLLPALLCACSETKPMENERYSVAVNTAKFAARNELEAQPIVLPQGTRAVIVPHGGEAIHMAAEVIAGLAAFAPKTVIFIAPNHRVLGPKIACTYAAFENYDGMVLPREDVIRALEGVDVGIDDTLFEDEHSVGILMPLLARYLPGAKAVPLIFQKGAPFNAAKRVLDKALALAGPDTVVVASIDFSHGLSAREERPRREAILESIRMLDSVGVLHLDGTFVDAPVVLAALLQRMKENGCAPEFIAQANSSELLGRDVPAATGYLTIAFHGG